MKVEESYRPNVVCVADAIKAISIFNSYAASLRIEDLPRSKDRDLDASPKLRMYRDMPCKFDTVALPQCKPTSFVRRSQFFTP